MIRHSKILTNQWRSITKNLFCITKDKNLRVNCFGPIKEPKNVQRPNTKGK